VKVKSEKFRIILLAASGAKGQLVWQKCRPIIRHAGEAWSMDRYKTEKLQQNS